MFTLRPPLLIVATAVLAAAGAACGELDDITTVKDLRVLAVRAETPGFLVNLDDPGNVADPAELQSTLTALLVDPTTGGEEISFVAYGCPDFVDTITAATGQTTRVCAPPNSPPPAGVPPAIAAVLATVEITAAGTATPATDAVTAAVGIEYNPVVPAFGLTTDQVRLFFTPQPAIPQLDQTIQYNRDFGLDAIVDMTFWRGNQQASAIKRIVYWPDLRAEVPDQVPNRNPSIASVEFYRSRNMMTRELSGKWETTPPVVSVSAKDKLYVLPVLPVPNSDVVEKYPLRVRNTATGLVETRMMEELLVFNFFTTAGTFMPDDQENTPPIFDPTAPIRLDSQLILPTADKIPASGVIDIWIVVHDERAGANWIHSRVMIVP